jgi:hypothetical protein
MSSADLGSMIEEIDQVELLDQVELRFAVASTESAFEAQLTNLLVPTLLKLDTTNTLVHQKV